MAFRFWSIRPLQYFQRPPGLIENALALVGFVWMLGLLCSPGNAQLIPSTTNMGTLLLSPCWAWLYIHGMGLFSLLSLLFLGNIGQAFISTLQADGLTPVNLLMLLGQWVGSWAALLWVGLFWTWCLKALTFAIRAQLHGRTLRRQWVKPDWWIAPLLALSLCGLWATQLPLRMTFALAKPALEQIADAAAMAPTGELDFSSPQRAGLFEVLGAFRVTSHLDLSDEVLNQEDANQPFLVSLPIAGWWAYQGYVRDLSGPPGKLEAVHYSFAPGSNNGDQEIFYLGGGWYAFQNAFD